MLKSAVLGVVLVAFAVNCEPDDAKDKCMKVFCPRALKCCKSVNFAAFKEDAESCKPNHPEGKPDKMEKHMGPPPCDMDICVAKKIGYLEEDGKTVNKEAFITYLKDHTTPELAENIQKYCLDASLDQYGPKDFCDAIKLRHCAQLQLMKTCDEWDTEGQCPDVKASLEDCSAAVGAV